MRLRIAVALALCALIAGRAHADGRSNTGSTQAVWNLAHGGGGGSGANTTLSNLTAPTAINESLIFGDVADGILGALRTDTMTGGTATPDPGTGTLPAGTYYYTATLYGLDSLETPLGDEYTCELLSTGECLVSFGGYNNANYGFILYRGASPGVYTEYVDQTYTFPRVGFITDDGSVTWTPTVSAPRSPGSRLWSSNYSSGYSHGVGLDLAQLSVSDTAVFYGSITAGRTTMDQAATFRQIVTASGHAVTCDLDSGATCAITLQGGGADTLTLYNPLPSGRYLFELIQPSGSDGTITWPAAVHFPGGTAPTLTTTDAHVDIVSCYYNGTSYFCDSAFDFAP